MQPATLTLEKVQGSPLYSVLDVGALVRGSLAARSWIETGLRARAGSARPESQRVYGAMARVYRELDPVLIAVGGEYQADGGFDVHSLDATAELTPLGGLPGLGTWVSPAVHLRWRPWIGAAVGDGVRPYARLSADWVQGRLEAGVEETAWLVSGSGRSFVKGDVSVQLLARGLRHGERRAGSLAAHLGTHRTDRPGARLPPGPLQLKAAVRPASSRGRRRDSSP